MQTLITKYYGPTNTKPSRIKVTSWKGSKFYDWDNGLSVKQNHSYVISMYLGYEINRPGDENSWQVVAAGEMPDNTGYAFIIE